ncbi:MAG: response regulator [Anaerolineae bacterium]|nr:response regulator [Anaerolineae bacterium]
MFSVKSVENVAEKEQTSSLPHLFIIDDDPMNRLLLRRMFEPDYRITTAQSGIEGLTFLQQQTFDVVLLDIMMPDMSGLDVLQTIRQTYAHTDLPVILVSALHESDDIVRGFKIGANDYLAKPLNVEVARARVAMQLKLKQLSDEKKVTIGELQSLQTMREMFFRTVSHDLKGPISNIRMAQYILSDMFSHDPDVRLILENVELSLNGMQEMIQLFLDAAMLQSGTLELNIESVQLAEVIQRTIEQYQLSARGRNIQLHMFSTEHCAMVDRRLLAQIVGNLVSNALKFSPHNSTIMIWSEGDPHWVRINVADQGPGIPFEERKNLFQMFGKLSVRPVGSESSTGLGLWIVKSLVEMQGGKVGVDCPPDGGSIFWFELPGCVPLPQDGD